MNNLLFLNLHSVSNQSAFLDALIIFFAKTFPYLIIVFTILFLLFHHEVFQDQKPLKAFLIKWKEIIFSFIVGLSAWLFAYLFKYLFSTLRPYDQIENVQNLFIANGHAFPSGHATFFMALAISIYFRHKKIGLFLILSAILIGISRIMAGVHYPTDILAGFVLGVLIAIVFNYLLKKNSR